MPGVVSGVFFTAPQALPRGPRQLDRTQIQDMYRERFMIAYTELVAARGYSRLRVIDIANHAGTSKSAFYKSFRSMEECGHAAYDRFVEVLLAGIAQSLGSTDIKDGVLAILHAYLATLQRDIVVARAFQLELHNDTPDGRRQRREALTRFAEVVRAEHRAITDRESAENAELPFEAYLGIVYAVRQLASDTLDSADSDPDLIGLIPRLQRWITSSLRSPIAAQGGG